MIEIHPWTRSMHGLTGRARLQDGTPVAPLSPRDSWDRWLRYDIPADVPLELEYAHVVASGVGWRTHGAPAPACFLSVSTPSSSGQQFKLTLGTQEYLVRPGAITALGDAGAEVAAGLIDATAVIVAILTVEGYGEDMNVRLHRRN